MADAKFKPTGQDITEFIESVDSVQKRLDSYDLLKIFTEISGFDPEVWYPGIIGFGNYHYVYESGNEGDSSYVAFAPRKAKFSLYLSEDFDGREELLSQFGKYKSGKMCIYFNKLADIDIEVLGEMIRRSIQHTQKLYPQ